MYACQAFMLGSVKALGTVSLIFLGRQAYTLGSVKALTRR